MPARALLVYRLPLNEVVYDFHDRLKSYSRGYASFDYHLDGYRQSDLIKLSILINGDPVDSLALIVHRSMAEARGRALCTRLKELIPRQMYQVAIQAAIGGRIIARETVKPFRKDVMAKCYGGDVTRKRKLLEKQKAGKKRMRRSARSRSRRRPSSRPSRWKAEAPVTRAGQCNSADVGIAYGHEELVQEVGEGPRASSQVAEEGCFSPDDEVTVTITPAVAGAGGSPKRFIGRGKGLFASAREVDAYRPPRPRGMEILEDLQSGQAYLDTPTSSSMRSKLWRNIWQPSRPFSGSLRMAQSVPSRASLRLPKPSPNRLRWGGMTSPKSMKQC